MDKITLQCIKEKNKLRIRFYSFTNKDGKEFTNVYNNNYNCRFPRNIRQEGLFYEIGPNDIVLNQSKNTPFYTIKTNNIKILDEVIENLIIYEVHECVVCLENNPNIIFLPCGHLCTCQNCSIRLMNKCPLCRRKISRMMDK